MSQNAPQMLFHQMYDQESSTYTYLLADPVSREAILIDTVLEKIDRDLGLIKDMNLHLTYVLDTHVHADHITGAGEIRRRLPQVKTVISHAARVECADLNLQDGDEIHFGSYKLKILETPGHTDSCLSFYVDGKVFTGDALLIRGTGRTDFQQGSSDKLYTSITQKIFSLPEETLIYPGHDYRGMSVSSVELEKRLNPRVGGGKSREEFIEIMKNLKLALPKKIHEAVPANMGCGLKENMQ